jgi:hypothetical protein
MPKLLYFVTAERAIVAQDETISLITTFHGIKVSLEVLQPGALPENALIPLPMSWAAVAAWLRMPDDDGKTFELRLVVKLPDKRKIQLALTTFTLAARVHRTVQNTAAFPLIGPGEYDIELSIREADSKHTWSKVASLPIAVTLDTEPVVESLPMGRK